MADDERRMLFDIRGRRKHVVRVVYAILALLMGASLFLVVGPFNIGSLVNSGGSSEASKVLQEQAERTEQKLVRDPNNEALLLSLTRSRIAAANSMTEVNSETGATFFSNEGRRELERGIEAWNAYVKQVKAPKAPVAQLAARSYFGLAETSGTLEEALTNIEGAAKTQELAAAAQPTVNSVTTLAIYQYYIGDYAAGDKSTRKAEALAPSKAEAKKIGKEMAKYRKVGKLFEAQQKQAAKAEKSQSKERLENPLGSLSGAAGPPGG